MTEEQLSDLFLQLEYLKPADEKETFNDADFDAERRQLEEESRGVLWDDTEVVSGTAPPRSAEPNHAEEWEELDEDWWDKNHQR